MKESMHTQMSEYPWITILSGIILAIFNAGFITGSGGSECFHSFCSLMEFDRFLILRGEIWRLLTGHLVHWSPAHFYLDSIVFILQGITFEKKIGRSYWLMLLLSALFIGASLLIFRHNLSYYRGISGLINTQLVVGTGFFIMDKTLEKRIRGLYVICFSIHMIKIIYETIKRVPFFPTHLIGDMGLFTPGAHLSGIFLGFIFLIIYLMSISG
ncbi:MAG: rhombosortase, partial [Desulfobacteraceae bacterium]